MYAVPKFTNPYPAPNKPWNVTRVGFEGSGALLLARMESAVQTGVGKKLRDAHFIVVSDYSVTWSDGAEDHTLTVPAGMLTDFASVPRPLRGIISRTGPWLEATVILDFLTIAWITVDGDGSRQRRRFADEIMRAAMTDKVAGFRKSLIYWSVRLAGWWFYPKRARAGDADHLYIDMSNPDVVAQLPVPNASTTFA